MQVRLRRAAANLSRRRERNRAKRAFALARIIHHYRGASLGIHHHSVFVSLTNTTSIRSVTENTVITNPCAIRSLSGELSRLLGNHVQR